MEYKAIYNTVKNVCFRDVIYANGQWVFTALGIEHIDNSDNNQWTGDIHICTSADLKTFTDKIIHTFVNKEDLGLTPKLAYGNGIYIVGTPDRNNTMYKSVDLTTWSKINFSQDYFNNIKFINGQFIVVTWCKWTRNGSFLRWEGHILTSKDGQTWINKATFDKALKDITYYNGYYYVVGTDGYIAKSTNLTNWVQCNSGISEEIRAITSGGNGLVAVADNKIILFSTNGNNWQKVFENCDREITKVAYGNGIYMIMTAEPNSIAYSKDGITWEWFYRGTGGYNYGMAFSQEQQMFLICGNWWTKDDTGSIVTVSISREIVSSQVDNEILYIYDLDFNFIGTIDSFKSLRWRRKYFEAGEFEIVLTPDDTIIDYLKNDYLIMRNNYTEAGIIETISFSDNGTDEDYTISGRFLSSILDRRIVKKQINFNGTSVDGMKSLLYQMSPFPKFEIEQTTFDSENINFQCTYKNIYDYLIKLSKYSNVGFRIVPNLENKVFIFENYRGLDRTISQEKNERYSFSDDEYNIDKSELTISNSTKVNYALVGGTGEDTNRTLVEVNLENATGFKLFEKFVDSKNQSSNGLSNDEYKKILYQDGVNSLTNEVSSFSFDVSADDYKDKFDLGDIVNVAKPKWDYISSERITEIEEIIEDGKKSINIVTGTPLPEKFIDD